MLKSKLSRVIFCAGVALSFFVIHFTDALQIGGLDFERLATYIERDVIHLFIYLGLLFVPALLAAFVLPMTIKWIKAGT